MRKSEIDQNSDLLEQNAAGTVLRVATLNCNGLRACLKKGLEKWMLMRKPDILCLQEIRARPQDLGGWAEKPLGMRALWAPAERPGYAGVALLSIAKPKRVEMKFGAEPFDSEGRWILADFGAFAAVSLYLPSGSSGEARQLLKFRSMKLLRERLDEMRQRGTQTIVAGDVNIAHTKKDIRNWKGNLNNSGFLPEERAWMTDVLANLGWTDAFREVDDRDGRYTWWSMRSGARKRDIGWRIDYQLVTPELRPLISTAQIDKEPVLSDHAPLVVDYQFPAATGGPEC